MAAWCPKMAEHGSGEEDHDNHEAKNKGEDGVVVSPELLVDILCGVIVEEEVQEHEAERYDEYAHQDAEDPLEILVGYDEVTKEKDDTAHHEEGSVDDFHPSIGGYNVARERADHLEAFFADPRLVNYPGA